MFSGVNANAVRLGYFLAISLLLSALLYFFASNWPLLHRWEKIGVSLAVLTLFYLFSYLFSFLLKKHAFLGNWLLAAGGLAFGVSVALLGQIYNSHADSYMLFVVWLVPNLLFALLTRYQPFYVISYGLAHLAFWFYVKPSALVTAWDAESWFWICWIIALANLAVFWLTSAGMLVSSALRLLSFPVFSTALLFSAFAEAYGPVPEILYMLAGGALFLTFLKWKPNRGLLLATSVFLALFFLGNFFQYMFEHFTELFFVIGVLIAAGLVGGAAAASNWLKRDERLAHTPWLRVLREAFVVLVTVVASLIGVSSIMGLVVLLSPDEVVIAFFLFILSAIGFLLPAVYVQRLDPAVRYTLLTMGFLLGAFSTIFQEFLWVFFLAVLVAVWSLDRSLPGRMLAQLTFLLVLYAKLESLEWSEHLGLYAVFVLQMAMYAVLRLHPVLRSSSLFYALLALLGLTVQASDGALGVIVNLGFLALSTCLLYWTIRSGRKGDFGISLGFWFAFLLMKYYDYIWSLLHKSFSLLLLSALFFAVSFWLERRSRENAVRTETKPLVVQKKWLLVPVVLLQFAIVGYQAWSSETILTQGTLVKLKLEPIDPRSLLQGDYVRLGYNISRLEAELSPGETIRVVLRSGEGGIYTYSGYHEQNGDWNRPYRQEPGDVVINGRVYDVHEVDYGIESYFVPEGTGRDVEEKAKYALVRIGKNGDALLESLAEE